MIPKPAKVGERGQVTIPQDVRDAVGLKSGQLLEAIPSPDGSIILRQQVVIDKNLFDAVLKRRIEEAEVAVKGGRVLGPFDNSSTALRAVKKRAHARRAD